MTSRSIAYREMFDADFFKGVAHRGIHDNKTVTENGLKAFGQAIAAGVAFELDVHLSKDRAVIVSHDENLKRTTGKDGAITALTAAQIKSDYRLLDGGIVPALADVLALDRERALIVVELKTDNGNAKELAAATLEVLGTVKNKRKIMVISFDHEALGYMKASGFARALLLGPGNEKDWQFRDEFESLDLDQRLLAKAPVKVYRKTHFVNAYTIETAAQLAAVAPLADTVTFQTLDPALVGKALAANRRG